MSNAQSLLVRPAAWWILYVVSPIAGWAWSLAWFLVGPFSRLRAYRLASFLQMQLVPFLLLEFLVWSLAEDYLRAKLAKEKSDREDIKHLSDYDYWQSLQKEEANRRQS